MSGLSDIENKIGELLSNPDEMSKIMDMARQLMGSGAGDEKPAEKQEAALPGLDPMLKKLMGAMGGMREQSGNKAVLRAIAPYLGGARAKKLERALKMAEMARLARVALAEYGGDVFGD